EASVQRDLLDQLGGGRRGLANIETGREPLAASAAPPLLAKYVAQDRAQPAAQGRLVARPARERGQDGLLHRVSGRVRVVDQMLREPPQPAQVVERNLASGHVNPSTLDLMAA